MVERSFLWVIVSVVALVAAAMGTTSWMEYKDSSALIERTQERLQSMICEEIGNELTMRLDTAREKVALVANLPSLVDLLRHHAAGEASAENETEPQLLFDALYRQYPSWGNILVLNTAGQIVFTEGAPFTLQLTPGTVQRLLLEPTSVGVDILTQGGEPVPYVAARIMDGDTPRGLVLALVQLRRYAPAWTSRFLVGEQVQIDIYSADKQRLLHVETDNLPTAHPVLEEDSIALFGTEDGTLVRAPAAVNIAQQTARLVTVSTMPHTGWKVVMSTDYAAVMNPLNVTLKRSLLLNGSLLTLMLVGLCSIILHRSRAMQQREQTLVETNRELQSLTSNMPGGVFKLRMDELYTFTYGNEEFYRVIGLTSEQLHTERKNSLLYLVDPDYLPNCVDALHYAMEHNEIYEFRHPIIRHDGSEAWLLVRGSFTTEDQGYPVMDGISLDITPSMSLEQELQKSRDRLELLIETCSVPLWIVNNNDDTLYYNEHIVRLLGWEDDGFNSCSVVALMERMHPDDRPAFEQDVIAAIAAGKDVNDVEYRLRHGDGHWHWVMARGRKVISTSLSESETMGTLLDMHAHKTAALNMQQQAEILEELVRARTSELNTERMLLRTMMDAIPDLFYFKDVQGVFKACNRAFLSCFGLESEQVVLGRTNREIFSDQLENVAVFDQGDQSVLQSEGSLLLEYGITMPGNAKVDFETIKTLMRDEAGQVVGIVGISRDITARKRMENQLRESQREAETASKAKSDFLANMSHEIRTPLNGIIGMNYLARQASPAPNILGYLEKMDRSAQNLLGIINDILDFSKIEAGKVTLEYLPFSPRSLVNALCEMFEPAVTRAGIELVLDAPDELPATCLGDALRLNQVLMNLMSNAVKFTSKGQVTLGVQVTRRQEDRIVLDIRVQDTGIGMNQAECDKLFSAFSQADTSITRRYGGTGLGLSISKGLLELMGGFISVQSWPGKGSVFKVTLPLDVQRPEESTPESENAAVPDTPQHLDGLRVLLVEDNDINQMIAEEILGQFGCVTDLAPDGLVAVEMTRANTYDLILMDIQMPVMDGMQATRTLRADHRFDTLPIIAMTAHALQSDVDKSLAIGMQDHLTKPIDPEKLRETLSKWSGYVQAGEKVV